VIDGNCRSRVSIVDALCRPLLTQRVMAIGFMCVSPDEPWMEPSRRFLAGAPKKSTRGGLLFTRIALRP
jgi:hypothetical protein